MSDNQTAIATLKIRAFRLMEHDIRAYIPKGLDAHQQEELLSMVFSETDESCFTSDNDYWEEGPSRIEIGDTDDTDGEIEMTVSLNGGQFIIDRRIGGESADRLVRATETVSVIRTDGGTPNGMWTFPSNNLAEIHFINEAKNHGVIIQEGDLDNGYVDLPSGTLYIIHPEN